MKKIIFVSLLFFITQQTMAGPSPLGLSNSIAKKDQHTKGFDKTHLFFGGNIGVGFMPGAFSIYLAPSLGYAFHENFYGGVTLGLNYYQEAIDYRNLLTNQPETYKYRNSGYSFSIYGRYIVKNFLLLNFEPEINNIKVGSLNYDYSSGKMVEISQRTTIPSVLAGLGIVQRFDRGYFFISLNYDLLQNPNSVYYRRLDYRAGLMIQLFN